MSRLILAALTATLLLIPGAAAAHALEHPHLTITNSRTQPVFDYDTAIRETVYVDVPTDTDSDGKRDRVAMRITRPKETDQGLDVASIVQPSPYYGATWDNPNLQWHPDDVVDLPQLAPWEPPTGEWQGWREHWVYNDNYFVPRGYAVVKMAALGTWESTGCPVIGDHNDRLAMKAVVDWLAGRTKGYTPDGSTTTAYWSTGAVAMTGKSHEGSLPLMAAATGVEGLRTVVSIMGVANWYDVVRRNGGVVHSPQFPGDDLDMTAKVILTRQRPATCETQINRMSRDMDRVTGDYNEFWDSRNLLDEVSNFPPTFLVAGLRDTSVTTKHFADQWRALGRHDIVRKAWLLQAGHDDPLYVAEQRWLDAVHAWYDHWLYGIDNGVTAEPAVDLEVAPGQWRTTDSWPANGAEPVRMRFGDGEHAAQPGALETTRSYDIIGGKPPRHRFVDASKLPTAEKVEDLSQPHDSRLAYLSEPLEADVRLSGTPRIQVRAKINGPGPYLTAYLVDLGSAERVTGFSPTDDMWCFGPGTEEDSGCRPRWEYQTGVTPYHVVSRGWQDARNRVSDEVGVPVDPSVTATYRWDLEPTDYVFRRGHRIAVVVMATDYEYTLRYPAGTEVTVPLAGSGITLPLVGSH